MKEQETIRIGDFREGTEVEAILWLTKGNVRETKAGKPYWDGTFQDATGSIGAKLWEDRPGRVELAAQRLVPGSPCRIRARVEAFKGSLQLTLAEFAEVPRDQVDMGLFSPRSSRSTREMVEELDGLLGAVRDPDLNRLLESFRKDREAFTRFCQSPAAKTIHHAWVGGLLEHTLSLARLITAVAPLYPAVKADFLLVNALFHDAGKALEISREPGFDYTDDGKLLGHIYMGARLAERLMDGIPGFPEEKRRHVVHLILSHQGDRSDGFGSPVDPLTPEAILFHHLDNLDAKVQNCLSRIEEAERAGEPDSFTNPRDNYPIRKGYYRRRPSDPEGMPAASKQEAEAGAADDAADEDPPRLW